MESKIKSKEKGITLIALIITIIILLILAGITISAIAGKNGVLNQAENSSTKTEEAKAKEAFELGLAGAQAEYYEKRTKGEDGADEASSESEWITLKKINKNLGEGYKLCSSEGKILSVLKSSLKENGTEAYISKNGKVYKITYNINEEGKPSVTKIESADIAATEPRTVKMSEINSENFAEYLGWEVIEGYEARGSSVKIGNETYVVSDTYRLFYIDYDDSKGDGKGKYGDGIGTIYLKADCTNNKYTLNSPSLYSDLPSSENKYKQLNPLWTNPNMEYMNTKCVIGMLEPSKWEKLKGEGANYVVASPTLEMFSDSYNKFLDANPGILNAGGTEAQKMEYQMSTYGYISNATENINFLINNSITYGMYNSGLGKYYWLSSPCFTDGNRLYMVNGTTNRLYYYEFKTALEIFCPLVSLPSSTEMVLADVD